TEAPGSASIFSTLTRSPTATLYCLPPDLTIAYMEGYPLLVVYPSRRPRPARAAAELWCGGVSLPAPLHDRDCPAGCAVCRPDTPKRRRLTATAQDYATAAKPVKPGRRRPRSAHALVAPVRTRPPAARPGAPPHAC